MGYATGTVPDGARCRLRPEAAPYLDRPWPSGEPWLEHAWPRHAWPRPGGIDLATYGPDDCSAVGAVLTDCPVAKVRDRGQSAFDLAMPVLPTPGSFRPQAPSPGA